MAKIPVYDTADREIHTEREGFAAEETAGRRIGPAFDRAATDVRDIGNVTASIFKARLWPFDIAELQRGTDGSGGSGSSRRTAQKGGGGIKLQGDPNPSAHDHAGATGQLGNVAAAAAYHFNGTPTNGKGGGGGHGGGEGGGGGSRGGGGRGGGGGSVDENGVTVLRGGSGQRMTQIGPQPGFGGTINDDRKMTPGNFPDRVSPGLENRFDPNKDPNAVTWPRGLEEQPSNPDFLRREAEQQVYREPLGGSDFGGGDYGGGGALGGGSHYDIDMTPGTGGPQEESSFPSSVWQGIRDFVSQGVSNATPDDSSREEDY